MDKIIARYRKIWDGKTWYGKNISESLEAITISKRTGRIQDSYNIIELVLHMLAWRKYVIALILTGVHQEVPEQENFPKISDYSDENWQGLLEVFAESQRELLAIWQDFDLGLSDASPKSGYTWEDIFNGIINHDVYHLGQINLLQKYAHAIES